uniref:Putative secreted protein n=1 Tax=Anopheles darlingi TaxID=43151 RepID=A0A2M4D433_ANODA
MEPSPSVRLAIAASFVLGTITFGVANCQVGTLEEFLGIKFNQRQPRNSVVHGNEANGTLKCGFPVTRLSVEGLFS